MLRHSAEAIASEKDTELTLLGSCHWVTQTMVGQLRPAGLLELPGDQASCQEIGIAGVLASDLLYQLVVIHFPICSHILRTLDRQAGHA